MIRFQFEVLTSQIKEKFDLTFPFAPVHLHPHADCPRVLAVGYEAYPLSDDGWGYGPQFRQISVFVTFKNLQPDDHKREHTHWHEKTEIKNNSPTQHPQN